MLARDDVVAGSVDAVRNHPGPGTVAGVVGLSVPSPWVRGRGIGRALTVSLAVSLAVSLLAPAGGSRS
ncbi:N-acetyltransferase [Streptomyces pluripotens]|uniref:N-acetyltransferase n=1 Tax=Streptomyces pluripotens TaxID=1355015 RepID=A0A221NVF1_9ACTN|nr:N-acetyltransferase [Streptomyces pluripotens]